jgi:alkylation response protein AidB-like acyl-CoA dehydrogenase
MAHWAPATSIFGPVLEHKMGIKSSATAQIELEGAIGTLVGQPNKGMQGMFVMMNAARLGVGNQSLGLTEVAFQNALVYAKERIQMRSLSGVKAKDKPADPIIVHPDVRKMLLTAKAYAEGGRALMCSVRMLLEKEHNHPDEKVRKDSGEMLSCSRPSSRRSSPTTATFPPMPVCRCLAGTALSKNRAWSSLCATTAST